jgi:exopolysaccharide biosynthesis predicted pyruvyltransferase EpsI
MTTTRWGAQASPAAEILRARFVSLSETIRENAAGLPIVYVPNPGNYGDALIRYATRLFFDDFAISYTELDIGFTQRKKLLRYLLSPRRRFFIYGGGGSWCDAYRFGESNCAFISRFTSRLLVLPTTFAKSTTPVRGTLFRRDELQSASSRPESQFCHDMAFYLYCAKNSEDYSLVPIKQSHGSLMRTDLESAREIHTLPAENVDLSVGGDHMSDGAAFVRQVASYGEIYTDRLHVAIAGTLAGRRVHMMAGNYFKNTAIFHSSIGPWFPNVTLEHAGFDLGTALPRRAGQR